MQVGAYGRVGAGSLPRPGGYAVTDASAILGAVGWLTIVAAAVAGRLALGEVELFVSLALLVFVPLGLGRIPVPREPAILGRLVDLAALGQLPAAAAAVGALALPVGSVIGILLCLPWLALTGALALAGLARFVDRGPLSLPALAVDAALLYLPVGAVALVFHRAGINLQFRPIIVLLTVVHYHYAGFVLPLIVGVAGRRLTDGGRFERTVPGVLGGAATAVVVANLALIAVGITFSPLIEVVAVALFTVAVAALAGLVLWRVVPTLPTRPAVLLGVAMGTLFATMALALAYGYSAFPATGRLLTIAEMVRWHGTLNAFGFALPGLLAIRWLDAPTAD